MKQVAFIDKGIKYVTLFGASDFLQKVDGFVGNAAPSSNIQSKMSFSGEFRKISDIDIRMLPIVEDASVELKDYGYYVTGKVTVDGETVSITVDESGVHVPADEQEDIPEPKVENTPEPEPAPVVETEPEPESEPVVETTPEPGSEPVVESTPEPEPVVESTPEPEPVVLPEPTVSEPVFETKSVLNGEVTRHAKSATGTPIRNLEPGIGFSIGKKQNSKQCLIGTPITTRTGISLGTEEEIHVAASDFKGKPVLGRSSSGFFTRALEIAKEETPAVIPALNMSSEASVYSDQRETPQPVERVEPRFIESAPPQREILETYEAPACTAKERLRAELSPEINAVIGDIPHPILGDIAEFTTEIVDQAVLREKGYIYCIDNHWHKAGNWFAIDQVSTSNRIFYNQRRNICIEIPTRICLKWLHAVNSK